MPWHGIADETAERITTMTTDISAVSDDGTVKFTWVNLGEGLNGDFDPHDINDVPLLRFDAFIARHANPDGEPSDDPNWTIPDDGSFCTQVAVDTSPVTLTVLALQAADTLAEAWRNGTFGSTAQSLTHTL